MGNTIRQVRFACPYGSCDVQTDLAVSSVFNNQGENMIVRCDGCDREFIGAYVVQYHSVSTQIKEGIAAECCTSDTRLAIHPN